jgi:formylglycine-generating enzyme required for sulfatase activity
VESVTDGAIRVADGERTPPPAETYSESSSVASVVEVVLGETIGRYQVRRLLGQGGMGRVYLARDVVLGRAIALKVVIGALLHEARVIAQLNHPNIVQLHDSGEHRGGIYLALEYVDGTTLRDRMTHGGIGADEALRYALSIADALAHAHAAGIYHCDLKPSNVMVGRDGRIRVLDFGIARTADDAGGATSGTEAWMAPEQSTGAALTDRVDSWALAIVATQLLTGGHPLGDTPARRQETVHEPSQAARAHLAGRAVPAVVADLIVRALSRDPRARPSAVEWKRAFDDVLNGRADALAEECPFPGLASFDERHARFYFGREREIDEFLERLRDAACLPIVGPSGTGKSSFLHAGVIPRLRARASWTVLSFRPGSDPLGTLARHVLAAGTARPAVAGIDLPYKQQIQALRAELLATPTLLAARLATLGTALGSSILLAVDQLEEVFTQCESAVERDRFLEMLLGTANDPLDPVRVVFTVRDDFVGKIAGLRTLFVLHKPRREDLWRTIVHPLTRCRYELDDSGIVDDLLSEIGTAEADLPLLQFACRTLWEGRDVTTRRLRRSTYEEMGGLAGALARHAERALAELTPAELRIARGLLLRLVSGATTPSHGDDINSEALRSAAEDRGAVGGTTRRAVARDQLVMTVGSSAEAVLDRLLAARLLAQRNQGGDESPIIEIAHESLLRTWAQLARWLAESRDERRLLDELQDTVSLWERRGARLEETWPQDDIAAVRRRAGQLALALPGHIHAFLAAGEARHRAHQRRRRVRYGMALALATAIAVPAFIWIGRYLEREHLIRTNAGTVDIVFRMYDSQAETPVPVAIAKAPELRWTLHTAKPGNPHEAGEPIPQPLIETLADSSTALERRLRIRAPGGTHFLRIDGRGGPGETCEPSWIRIQSFPGYAGDASPEVVAIDVPTCAASRADMLVIEAGEFIYGGPGEVASTHYGERDYDDPERRIDLPQFAMDKTELSNARFAMFGRLERVTGYPAPQYSDDAFHLHDRDPTSPVTDINLFEAEAYCRYMGKTLPTQLEWVKAARGGLRINGVPNPYPRRLFPWGPNESSRCANQAGSDDGNAWTAPVTSYNDGDCTGPYGHLNLVGNVDEWMAREAKSSGPHGLAVIRGGSANSPPEYQHISTIYVNQRDPQWFDYAIGFRCVTHD